MFLLLDHKWFMSQVAYLCVLDCDIFLFAIHPAMTRLHDVTDVEVS